MYSELSLQFSSGLQSRLMGSQPGAPGMGPYGPSIHCSCIRTRKSQAFFGEQLAVATVAAAAASCSRSMRGGSGSQREGSGGQQSGKRPRHSAHGSRERSRRFANA